MITNPFRANGWSADTVYTAVQQPQQAKAVQPAVTEEVPVGKIQEKTVEKNNIDTYTKSIYKPTIDISAVKLDLNLDFNAESIKDTLDSIIGRKENKSADRQSEKNTKKKNNAGSFLSVDLSASAKGVEVTKVSGPGRARSINVHYTKRAVRKEQVEYTADNVKVKVRRRQREAVDDHLQVRYQWGYRTVKRKIEQRYHDDVSVQAQLLKQFDNTSQKVAENKPEDTGRFLKTTDKLVSNKKVTANTVSKFFDVVGSYVDRARSALHSKIDQFLDKIANNFNVDNEKLDEMRANLHNKVDSFFENVDNTLNKLEDGAIDFVQGTPEQKEVEEETAHAPVEEPQAEPEPVDIVA